MVAGFSPLRAFPKPNRTHLATRLCTHPPPTHPPHPTPLPLQPLPSPAPHAPQACVGVASWIDHSWEHRLPPADEAAKAWLSRRLQVVKWVGAGLFLLQLLTLLLSCGLQSAYVSAEEAAEDAEDDEAWRRRPLLQQQEGAAMAGRWVLEMHFCMRFVLGVVRAAARSSMRSDAQLRPAPGLWQSGRRQRRMLKTMRPLLRSSNRRGRQRPAD